MLEIKEFNKIIVANWKLNGSNDFLEAYFEELDLKDLNSDTCGVICPPISYIQNCYSKLKSLYLGAQNCSKFKTIKLNITPMARLHYNKNRIFCGTT